MKRTHSRATARFRKMATLFAVGALASVLGTADLDAQEVDTRRAAVLEAEADALLADQGGWKKAAELLQDAAELRPEGDAQARKDLFRAARLTYYRGAENRAVNQLEGLADRALAEGDVLTAAQALADAAWIANEAGMDGRTLEFSERVQKLALSPYLTDRDREQLTSRFHGFAG